MMDVRVRDFVMETLPDVAQGMDNCWKEWKGVTLKGILGS